MNVDRWIHAFSLTQMVHLLITQQQHSYGSKDHSFKEIIQWITFVSYRPHSPRRYPGIDLSVRGVISGCEVALAKRGFTANCAEIDR